MHTRSTFSNIVISAANVQELATKTLHIQSKKYYLDVKQNRRGRFLKIAEVPGRGPKKRLTLRMPAAAELRDYLTDFSEHYAQLGPANPDNIPEDGRIKSEQIISDNRRYYLDLKENNRGRFLKVSQTGDRGPRIQIAVPAQGLVEFKNALTELLEEFGTDDPSGVHEMMNDKKQEYVCVTGQVEFPLPRSQYRTSITIPEKSWSRFRDTFTDYCSKMDELKKTHPNGGGAEGHSREQEEEGSGSRDAD
ncbi:putative transcriptional activator protein Pur-beta [Apostichopus japonicus]|uniref:Putative transcriptional activator protein Pur-beta n=1 Tax=Stichopus japonicus TaxID=307972 RepID=A0A2G8LQ00_STIJA|nr:putative transcriptional activator protein Pur-beta [Apostichopus japonicus]